jgi:hypothetical protein
MKQDSMVEALRRRKAQGVNITISVAPKPGELDSDAVPGLMGEESEEDKEHELAELDQAPDASEVGEDDDGAPPAAEHEDEEQDRQLFRDEMAKANFGKGSLAALKNKQLSKAKV